MAKGGHGDSYNRSWKRGTSDGYGSATKPKVVVPTSGTRIFTSPGKV